MNVVFELTAHHIERVGVNAHSPACDESYIGRADRLCKIPKSVVFVPLARLRAVVEIPTCKVVSAIHVEDVRCRSNGLAVRTAHGLRGFEIGVFAGIDLAAFKLSVRRNGKIELHVYGVVRPFCRESLIVERIVYRKGEVFGRCAVRCAFYAYAFKRSCGLTLALVLYRHSESGDKFVPRCDRNAAVNADADRLSVLRSRAECGVGASFTVHKVESERHSFNGSKSVLEVQCKRAFCVNGVAVVVFARFHLDFYLMMSRPLDICSVLVRLEHIFGEIAVNALRSRVRLRVEINHAILDVGNIELVNVHALEHGRYALWEGKFELRRHRTVVTAGFDYIGRIDAVGQLACVLRALVARNHTYRKHDKQDSNQK